MCEAGGRRQHQRSPGAVPGEDGGGVQEAPQSAGAAEETTGKRRRKRRMERIAESWQYDGRNESYNERAEPTGVAHSWTSRISVRIT